MTNHDQPNLHAIDTGGSGQPVILIHGWPLSHKAWENQVQALERGGFRVIAYDRRGFGASEKPDAGYDYDTLAADLHRMIEEKDLRDVVLVGFSMGGGEVARYVGLYGEDRIGKLVFASAVPPYLMKTDDNPDGPLDEATAKEFETSLKDDRETFFKGFAEDFFTAGGELVVPQEEVDSAVALCLQSDQTAALQTMDAWANTDFREDLKKITKPTLVLHGDSDGVVPFEGSGKRTHEMVDGAELHVIEGAPHGCNVSHTEEFNRALISFLQS